MAKQALSHLKGGWLLLRSIAVISSSVATITSTILPLLLYYPVSTDTLVSIFSLLVLGAFLIHGVLTHVLNDYIDHESGTDIHSPAILSGGSRVIQSGLISPETLWRLGKVITLLLCMSIIILITLNYYKLAILLAIGLWGATSYSLPSLRLSYRPFAGEWISTFPSVFFLGLAGAWITLDHIPEWAFQNALINALFCIAWVMIHHIPDREADKNAIPKKQTSVVWASDKFGTEFSHLPALFYFVLAGLCAVWLGFDRLWAMTGLLVIVITVMFFIRKMKVDDDQQVSAYERIILILAIVNAVWLGIFI